MLASVRSFVISTLAAATVVALLPSTAAASTTSASQCQADLADLDESREALDGLQASVESAQTSRANLEQRVAEIRDAFETATPDERIELAAERRGISDKLATIDLLLPPILAQATALAQDVETAERSYLVCIERSLEE